MAQIDPKSLSDRELLIATYVTVNGLSDTTQDHERRIRRLEIALWLGIGFATTTGAAVGSFVGSLKAAA